MPAVSYTWNQTNPWKIRGDYDYTIWAPVPVVNEKDNTQFDMPEIGQNHRNSAHHAVWNRELSLSISSQDATSDRPKWNQNPYFDQTCA